MQQQSPPSYVPIIDYNNKYQIFSYNNFTHAQKINSNNIDDDTLNVYDVSSLLKTSGIMALQYDERILRSGVYIVDFDDNYFVQISMMMRGNAAVIGCIKCGQIIYRYNPINVANLTIPFFLFCDIHRRFTDYHENEVKNNDMYEEGFCHPLGLFWERCYDCVSISRSGLLLLNFNDDFYDEKEINEKEEIIWQRDIYSMQEDDVYINVYIKQFLLSRRHHHHHYKLRKGEIVITNAEIVKKEIAKIVKIGLSCLFHECLSDYIFGISVYDDNQGRKRVSILYCISKGNKYYWGVLCMDCNAILSQYLTDIDLDIQNNFYLLSRYLKRITDKHRSTCFSLKK